MLLGGEIPSAQHERYVLELVLEFGRVRAAPQPTATHFA
jgi:hypothetical protein